MKNSYEMVGNDCFINLQHGHITVIDKSDFQIANSVSGKWYASYNRHTKSWYCVCNVPTEGKRTIARLNRLVAGASKISEIVDHVDHNTLNNTRSNIRIVSNRENLQNQIRAHVNNETGMLGVNQIAQTGRYRAMININGKSVHVGMFDTAKAAHEAYMSAKKTSHDGAIFMGKGGLIYV